MASCYLDNGERKRDRMIEKYKKKKEIGKERNTEIEKEKGIRWKED